MSAELLPADDPALLPSGALRDVVALLDAYPSATGRGTADASGTETYRQRMLAFAATHPDALVRTCAPGHFTGSAFVVDPTATRTLVLFHRKLQRWLQPGGHADGDANLAGVALREATEETGIDGLLVDPVPVDLDIHEVAPPHERAHLHLDVRFLVVAPADAVVRGNHESEALRWVDAGELAALGVDSGTRRLARAAFARARR